MENAIKHKIISKSKPLTVKLYVSGNKYLVLENNIQEKQTQISTKVGLENIVDRYLHIARERVIIEKDEKVFRVWLPVLDYYTDINNNTK